MLKLLRRDVVYAAEESGAGGGGRGREVGDGSVHLVQRRVDGTWTAWAEEGAAETWVAGSGGENGSGGVGHGSP